MKNNSVAVIRTDIATLQIGGMHCTSCSRLVQGALADTPGVTEVNVNFASEKARIKFNPEKVTIADLIKAIVEA